MSTIVALSRRLVLLVGLGLLAAIAFPIFLNVLRADSLPQVQLNADSIEPRPIEELTGTNVTRDYANAWRDLAQALDKNQADHLDAYFTGFAKNNFTQKISDQKTTGVHVRYVDHGHKVKAFFYSPDGGEMQLLDKAQLEIQVYDGGKLIYQEDAAQDYLVLMTPGADRWFVRSLEPIAGSSF
ncbi:MAG TPA: hypothetical protein VJX16_05700 [Terriglobales bacterium]|nr:hypothetical protein [Terriglobales bacterium]